MRRGDIFYIEATGYQTTGSEQRPGRPGIIVSNEKCNENSEVVEVVYTTTQPKKPPPHPRRHQRHAETFHRALRTGEQRIEAAHRQLHRARF